MKTVCIDPGHGGWDPGAVAVDGIPEKQFTLELARAVRDALATYGCKVLMTREADQALAPDGELGRELQARANVGNQAGADLFVSLHHDSAGSSEARGGSIWVWTDKEGHLPADENHQAPRSFAIARKVYPVIQDALSQFGVPWRGTVMCSDFGVLRDSTGPAILVECFFGTNSGDVAAARRPDFIPALARTIAVAIAGALELPATAAVAVSQILDAEIARLKQRGLITSDHAAAAPVTWGEFATVLNRLMDRLQL